MPKNVLGTRCYSITNTSCFVMTRITLLSNVHSFVLVGLKNTTMGMPQLVQVQFESTLSYNIPWLYSLGPDEQTYIADYAMS